MRKPKKLLALLIKLFEIVYKINYLIEKIWNFL